MDDANAKPPQAPVPAPRIEPFPARRMGRRGLIIGSAVTLLLLGGLGWLAWHLAQQKDDTTAGGPRRTPPVTVGVAVVAKADIPVTLEALGTVTPTATVRVQAQVGGVLRQLLFQEGQLVKAGQLLATIDPRPFEMALMQASGQRQRDEAQLENARLTLKRYETLWQQDSIARQDLDTQAALVKQLEGTVTTDRAAEGTARINLGYTRIVAPVAGRIGLRTVDVGNVVSTGDANGVAVITAVSPIDVVFAVPQDQVPDLLKSAQAGPMTTTALDRTRANTLATGRFQSLDNQVDVQTGTVRAKARFANTDFKLFPNQFVNLRLLARTIKDATVIPLTAARFGNGGDYAFVLNADRTVSTRPIKKGVATADKVVILSGLQPGERVVTEGGDRLKDGARVLLPGDPVPTGSGRRRGLWGNGAASAPASGASGAATAPGSSPAPAPASAGPAPLPAATRSGEAASAPTAASTAASAPLPDAAQRQRMLDAVKGDPAQLERRQRFLEALDRGDPAALQRWQQIRERQQAGGNP